MTSWSVPVRDFFRGSRWGRFVPRDILINFNQCGLGIFCREYSSTKEERTYFIVSAVTEIEAIFFRNITSGSWYGDMAGGLSSHIYRWSVIVKVLMVIFLSIRKADKQTKASKPTKGKNTWLIISLQSIKFVYPTILLMMLIMTSQFPIISSFVHHLLLPRSA
jgi:hypothetical protein